MVPVIAAVKNWIDCRMDLAFRSSFGKDTIHERQHSASSCDSTGFDLAGLSSEPGEHLASRAAMEHSTSSGRSRGRTISRVVNDVGTGPPSGPGRTSRDPTRFDLEHGEWPFRRGHPPIERPTGISAGCETAGWEAALRTQSDSFRLVIESVTSIVWERRVIRRS